MTPEERAAIEAARAYVAASDAARVDWGPGAAERWLAAKAAFFAAVRVLPALGLREEDPPR